MTNKTSSTVLATMMLNASSFMSEVNVYNSWYGADRLLSLSFIHFLRTFFVNQYNSVWVKSER